MQHQVELKEMELENTKDRRSFYIRDSLIVDALLLLVIIVLAWVIWRFLWPAWREDGFRSWRFGDGDGSGSIAIGAIVFLTIAVGVMIAQIVDHVRFFFRELRNHKEK